VEWHQHQYRWDGEGWGGTDYNKLWIKSEGTLLSNGTLEDGQHQFL
jgi:copper resistance protein B